MRIYWLKLLNKYYWILDKISKKKFKRKYPKYLKKCGINIDTNKTENTWISPTTFFDYSKKNYITIGVGVTISFDVAILVHDYSIVHALRSISKSDDLNGIIYKPVTIGNNVFIGARVTILPGTEIGDNVIIGAGSVVKGKLEKNTIYCGNPAKKIKSVEEFVEGYVGQ